MIITIIKEGDKEIIISEEESVLDIYTGLNQEMQIETKIVN